jgi:hypothetical protein
MDIQFLSGNSLEKSPVIVRIAALVLAVVLFLGGTSIAGYPALLGTVDTASAQTPTTAEQVAADHADGRRGPDVHSRQLEQLRQRARLVSMQDSATAHAISLNRLARTGRGAALEAQLPLSPQEYAAHRAQLRRMGRRASRMGEEPMGPNAYSEWLNQLRRLSQ